jgi:uncharacterized protein
MLRPLGRAANSLMAPDDDQAKKIVPTLVHTLAFINSRSCSRLKVRELEQVRHRLHSKEETPYCLAAQGAYAAVTPAGDVYPCASLIGRSEYHIGSIELLHSPSLIRYVSDWGLPSECHACPARFTCRGGCPSRRIATTGSVQKKYHVDCVFRGAIYQSLCGEGDKRIRFVEH